MTTNQNPPPSSGRKAHPPFSLVETRDDPRAISEADFQAHLLAHQELEKRLDSTPVSIVKDDKGLSITGSGKYIMLICLFAACAFVAWAYLQ